MDYDDDDIYYDDSEEFEEDYADRYAAEGNTFDKDDNLVLNRYTTGTRSLLYDDNTDETECSK